jgi:hypothetical protein
LIAVERDKRAQLADQREDCGAAIERQALAIDLYRLFFSREQQGAKQAYQRRRCRNGRGNDRFIGLLSPALRIFCDTDASMAAPKENKRSMARHWASPTRFV